MNLQLSDIIIFLMIAAIFYAWWKNTSIREQALDQAKQHCQSLNLQLLDGSVSGQGWRPTWHQGTVKVKRTFSFEFSSSGIARYTGTITYLGNDKLNIWLSPHDI